VDMLQDEARKLGTELAWIPKSAVFRKQQLSTDGCLLLAQTRGTAESHAMDLVGGVWRGSGAGLFAGLDRDEFVSKCIAQSLHEEPRLWRLSDLGVSSLGRLSFADQPKELTRLVKQSATCGAPAKKRQRLANPLLGTAAYDSESGGSTASESDE
ncbi:abcG22, partial [Symbiodinium pilosum]